VSKPTALIVDWGGVLTVDMRSVVERWAEIDGIDLAMYSDVIRQWLGEPAGQEALLNPVHALERGEMTLPDFENKLAAALSERSGTPIAAEGLMKRMFEHFGHAHDMSALVRRTRAAGFRTALCSNSWGNDYPRDGWNDMFDAIVISGEVGMRKPERAIFEYTVDLVGVPADQCVFVDDMPHNVAAAVDLGMIGIRHVNYEATAAEIDALFGMTLSS